MRKYKWKNRTFFIDDLIIVNHGQILRNKISFDFSYA